MKATKRQLLLAWFSPILISGCAGVYKSAPDFNRIAVGMDKQQVIKAIGKPTLVSAENGREVLAYEWDNMWDGKPAGMWSYVGISSGKVVGYYTDPNQQSQNYNIAEAWTRVQSAPRTHIHMQQNNLQQNNFHQNRSTFHVY